MSKSASWLIVWALAIGMLNVAPASAGDDDPFLWLEEIQGEKAMAWVKAQNARTTAELEAVPEYASTLKRSLEIYDSLQRIPTPALRGQLVTNFWQDRDHERGIWRLTDLASFRLAEPKWETLLDLDALGKAEGVPWVFKGADCLAPQYRKCLISISRGGSDATVVREFDAVSKSFVDGGFSIPEAKTTAGWKNEDTLWVATEFGDGSLTTSGYPRIVKEWHRGAPLAEARTLYETGRDDVGAFPNIVYTPEGRYAMIVRAPSIFTVETFLALGDRLVRLDLPKDASPQGIFRDHVLFSLRSDWQVGGTTYRQGSLLASDFDDLLRGTNRLSVLFEPSERVSLDSVATTRDRVVITTLDNVRSRLYRVALADGKWTREEVTLPGSGTASIVTASDEADLVFLTYEDFLTPRSLLSVAAGVVEKVKAMPAFFDAGGMQVVQYEATSKDGTRIPYFVVTPKGFVADGGAPTLLYGYGGFEVSEVPRYSGVNGSAWLARGGVYAVANIRGGGEFGPRWHQAALKANRIKSFEDFIAVAEDLVSRKITSPRHLGIMGGSQGGLLVGGTFVMRPELFNAVVCQVPLLDMRRYHKLLAGASWMEEYGNPDLPEEWAFIQTWSPYQLLRKDVRYPKVLFWTTTRDDRVHPGHARKMVAKMLADGHPVYYFEQIEGGHGSGSVNRQKATMAALEFSYLWKTLR